MRGRVFPLAGLLRIRKLEEDRARQRLADATSDLQERLDRAGGLHGYLRQTDERTGEGSSLAALAAARSATTGLLALIEVEAAALAQERDRAREELRDARARARALEKLEADHAAQVAAEQLRQEQLLLEEAASTGWARRGRGEA